MDAIKFERTQIHFFTDVFTAVVVVFALGPYSRGIPCISPTETLEYQVFLRGKGERTFQRAYGEGEGREECLLSPLFASSLFRFPPEKYASHATL